MLHYLGLLLLVANISARTYEGRNYQYTAISNKLDQYISNLGMISELCIYYLVAILGSEP